MAEEEIDDSAFILSMVKHRPHESHLKSLFSNQRISFYSNGDVDFGGKRNIGPSSRMNISQLESEPIFSFSRFISPKREWVFKLLALISAPCGVVIAFYPIWIYDAIKTYGYSGIVDHTDVQISIILVLFSILFVVLLDLFVGKFGLQESLELSFNNQDEYKIKGDIPKQEPQSFGLKLIAVVWGIVGFVWTLVLLDSISVPIVGTPVGMIVIGIGLLFLYGIIGSLRGYLFDDHTFTDKNGDNKNEEIRDLHHLYKAINLWIENQRLQAERLDNDGETGASNRNNEFSELFDKLSASQDQIPGVAPKIDELRKNQSAVFGAIIVRSATEELMKQVCIDAGVKWKNPNKKQNLNDYLQVAISRDVNLDSNIIKYVNYIRETGNTAAHDLNVIWRDFKQCLEYFCDIVEWYASITKD